MRFDCFQNMHGPSSDIHDVPGREHCRHRHRPGGFGGRWEGFGRGLGGGRERFFDSGHLRLVILQLIAEKPSYGYEIIKAIEERLAGDPARRERHDQIVPAARGSRHHLAPSGEADDLDPERGFLIDFAMERGMQRFAEFDPAARE